MGQIEWLALTCRACRRLIKLPPALAGKSVICPHCRTKILVPKDTPVIEEAGTQSQIPLSREKDDASSPGRGGHETWEVGQRPVGGEMNFRSRLHSTSDADMQRDPDQDMRRVNLRRLKMERTHPDFDDVDVERRKKRRRRSRSSGSFGRTFTRGLLVSVILLTGVVGWLGWEKWQQPKPVSTAQPKRVQQNAEPEPGADGKAMLEVREFGEYSRALAAAVKKFTSANTLEEMLLLVRDRARVEPKIRAYYTEANPWRPLVITNTFKPEETPMVDGEFVVVNLLLPDGGKRPLTMERSGETFLADWESFTGYGEMTWEELREKRPQQPVLMRVIIERSPRTEYWDGAFSDSTSHHCFQLRDIHSEQFLTGYTIKDSSVDKQILRYLRPAPPPSTDAVHCFAVVRLSYPPESKNPRQVQVSEFLEHGWVFRPDN